MLFNSFIFLVFAAVFFHIWPLLYKYRQPRWIFLTFASFIFYGWWDWRFLFLIAFSGMIDFFAARAMIKHPVRKRLWLVLSIIGNLASLGAFKYLGFLTSNMDSAIRLLGLDIHIPVVALTLPIGISFYTFQSMSYTIDVYKGKLEPTKNIFHFFTYLSMFPQLVAGPIIRASHLLPQLAEVRRPSDAQIWDGLKLIAYGYFKKVVIADSIAPFVNSAFAAAVPVPSAAFWWTATTLFAIQIYCDFSGYSDIARGLAKWMGYEFPLNFDHPYISRSIGEFWTRWHISLSTWFRDYLYYPLLSRRVTALGAHRSMWITMLICGLWHGAAWNFIIWGALHALYISIERLTNWPKRLRKYRAGRVASLIITIVLVWIGWVFFRAHSAAQAVKVIGIMFSIGSPASLAALKLDPIFISLILFAIIREAAYYIGIDKKLIAAGKVYPVLEIAAVALALIASVFFRGPGSAFIYFRF